MLRLYAKSIPGLWLLLFYRIFAQQSLDSPLGRASSTEKRSQDAPNNEYWASAQLLSCFGVVCWISRFFLNFFSSTACTMTFHDIFFPRYLLMLLCLKKKLAFLTVSRTRTPLKYKKSTRMKGGDSRQVLVFLFFFSTITFTFLRFSSAGEFKARPIFISSSVVFKGY